MSANSSLTSNAILQDTAITRLQPRSGWALPDFRSLWQYRDLLWFLAKRDIQVRYKQTALGALWAVIQPFGMMVVIAVFLGPITGVSDPVTLYAGLLPWAFFSATVNASSNSLLSNSGMLRKIYFPRLVLPIASVGAPMVDYLLGFIVFIGLMVWFQVVPGVETLLLPLMVLTTIVAALGVGMFVSALVVSYRDFRYVVPFLLQVMFFATPIIITQDKFPQWLQPFLGLNPIAGSITAMRSAVLSEPLDYLAWGISSLVAVLLLICGTAYFLRVERKFADVV